FHTIPLLTLTLRYQDLLRHDSSLKLKTQRLRHALTKVDIGQNNKASESMLFALCY
ncbi:hypothetical protein CHS0354_040445, partial [Potamilus streckersoni]